MAVLHELSTSSGLDEVCRRYGIARLEVFGSVSRGSSGPKSDIDLMYELKPGTHLGWNIENLTIELGRVLGRKVDLISRKALHPRLKESVLAEAKLLYAA